MSGRRGDPGAIAVVGSIHRDLVYEVGTLPRPGETVLASDRRTAVGGKGANQAMAAAAHGAGVVMIGAVGRDEDGTVVLTELRRRGIDTSAVVRHPAPTGRAIVAVDPHGENLIVVDGGASAALRPEDLVAATPRIADARVLLLQGEVPEATSLAAAGIARGTVVVTPAPVDGVLDLAAHADVLVPNVHEAERIVGLEADLDAPLVDRGRSALRHLDVPARVVLLTVGAAGVLVRTGDAVTHVPAVRTVAVDTTGAGDAFTGAVAAALAEGRELLDAVHLGVRYAAEAVAVRGATPPQPAAAGHEGCAS